jgi:hypothetical protein
MNMDEARESRITLETTIRDAVAAFHNATGAKVDSIDITRHEATDAMNGAVFATVYEIQVRAEL